MMSYPVVSSLVLLMTSCSLVNSQLLRSAWGWRCVNKTCIKEQQTAPIPLPSLSTCKLTCRSDAALWPRPTGLIQLGNETVHFLLDSLTLSEVMGGGDEVGELVREAFTILKSSLASLLPHTSLREGQHLGHETILTKKIRSRSVLVSVSVSNSVSNLNPHTREAYTLSTRTQSNSNTTTINILASDFFGARHALETLSQMIEWDDHMESLQMISRAAITDAPKFKYRGLMVDTSRNFLSIEALKRTIDGMAATKLNSLHLHLTSTHSFPLSIPSIPNMAFYGAYNGKKVYSSADLRELGEYGRVRGVRIIPELDAPANTRNGWQWGMKEGLGNLIVCLNKEACDDRPCGQLNIANNKTYTVLSRIYTHLQQVFTPLNFFHFGGSQVNFDCWNTTEEIINYLEEKGMGRDEADFYNVWGEFQSRVKDLLLEVNEGRSVLGIVRSSSLTEEGRITEFLNPEEYVVQVTNPSTDANTGHLLRKGYRIILSNSDAWDFACGLGRACGAHNTKKTEMAGNDLMEMAGNKMMEMAGKDMKYKGWQAVYSLVPHQVARDVDAGRYKDQVMGGEAVLWGYQVDDANIDTRLWPRGAALGERLWSNPSTGWYDAEPRFIHHRQRIVARGINAERIQPQWCHQNEGLCYE